MNVVSIIAFVLLLPVLALFSLGVPLIIGVCVYRDARKRVDCEPMLWALVAALVPSFIGLVIYLIVRRDYPLKETVRGTYENSYRESPYEVGGEYGQDRGYVSPAQGFPKWAKILIIVAVAVAAVCLLAMIAFGIITVLRIGTTTMQYYGF